MRQYCTHLFSQYSSTVSLVAGLNMALACALYHESLLSWGTMASLAGKQWIQVDNRQA
jgi:hypothetical protein